jgi:hypothetical protein
MRASAHRIYKRAPRQIRTALLFLRLSCLHLLEVQAEPTFLAFSDRATLKDPGRLAVFVQRGKRVEHIEFDRFLHRKTA